MPLWPKPSLGSGTMASTYTKSFNTTPMQSSSASATPAPTMPP
jgi:hypothetical protein